jgi:LysR family transcriptional regulator, transcriptional activator of the cysJI operon
LLLSPADLQILVRLRDGMTQAEIGNDLGIEQPAVSKSIRAAEARLGMALVQTHGRWVSITSLARALPRAGTRVLMQLRSVDDLIASLQAGRSGHTRVIASSTPGTYLLPPLIAEFLGEHSEAHIDIDVVPITHLRDVFMSGGYDVAFAPRLVFTGDFRIERAYVDPVHFFTSSAHPLAAQEQVNVAELQGEQLVGKFAEAYWWHVYYDLRQRGHRFTKTIELSTAEAVKRIVGTGVGVGMLFASSFQVEATRGDLVALNVLEPRYQQTYFFVRPAARSTPLCDLLCDFLKARWNPIDAG